MPGPNCQRPVLYLDVDGVLLTFEEHEGVFVEVAAPGARTFFRWARTHFEVRWLTSWATQGFMREALAETLARYLDCAPDVVRSIPVPYWVSEKATGIAWLEHRVQGRPFAWVEDGLSAHETRVLDATSTLDSYHHVDVVQDDPEGLFDVIDDLAHRFQLPLPEET